MAGKKTDRRPAAAPKRKLDRLRAEIDAADSGIVELLNRRARLAQEIGEQKRALAKAYYIPAREEDIIERLRRENAGPFPGDSIPAVFREIISACRSLEKKLKVAFFGAEASFTHIAARQQFGHSAQFLSERSIPDVFEEVGRGQADYGVVPIENSTEGVVSHTLDMFINSELTICAEIVLEIEHHLLSVDGDLGKIQRIYSHPQAVAQCRNWLRKHAANLSIHEAASTSEAARLAAVDRDSAAIASEFAGQYYGLKTIQARIEDLAHNYTRFLVIGKDLGPKSGRDCTAIVFSVKDRPGILYEILGHLASRGINMSKIESRPLKGRAWEYVFFVEMDGHLTDPKIREALKELEGDCAFVRVLGSFPKMRKEHQFLRV
jgi:chorismate mutase / prephenate dehydratase